MKPAKTLRERRLELERLHNLRQRQLFGLEAPPPPPTLSVVYNATRGFILNTSEGASQILFDAESTSYGMVRGDNIATQELARFNPPIAFTHRFTSDGIVLELEGKGVLRFWRDGRNLFARSEFLKFSKKELNEWEVWKATWLKDGDTPATFCIGPLHKQENPLADVPYVYDYGSGFVLTDPMSLHITLPRSRVEEAKKVGLERGVEFRVCHISGCEG